MTDAHGHRLSLSIDTRRPAGSRFLLEFWRYFRENSGAVGGLVVLHHHLPSRDLRRFIAPHSAIEQYREALLKPPIWQEGGDPRFILGTDAVGRDMLSRLIYGARYSLFIGIVVVAVSLVVGIVARPRRGLRRRHRRHDHHADHGHHHVVPEPASGDWPSSRFWARASPMR